MTLDVLLPVLQKARERYLQTLEGLKPEELAWRVVAGSNSIGFLIRHNAEVEYRFAAWFFGRPLPQDVTLQTLGPDITDDGRHSDWEALRTFLEQSHVHLTEAIRSLPEDRWDTPVEAPIGTLTPREALGRLIHHTGHHAGQIGLIRKYGGRL